MTLCDYKGDEIPCMSRPALKPNKSKKVKVKWDNGDKKYIVTHFELVQEKFCPFHLKKVKGLFDTTPEQIRAKEGRSDKSGTYVKGIGNLQARRGKSPYKR